MAVFVIVFVFVFEELMQSYAYENPPPKISAGAHAIGNKLGMFWELFVVFDRKKGYFWECFGIYLGQRGISVVCDGCRFIGTKECALAL